MTVFDGHQTRLGVVVIDCQTDDLTEAVGFWEQVFGAPGRINSRGKYARFGEYGEHPKMLLQAVDHPPRVHLDFETTDQAAEAARLEGLGATVVERSDHGWTVMEAPTGHRFCLVNPQGEDWPRDDGSDGGPPPKATLAGLSIDCQDADVATAQGFWAAVFGDAERQTPDETFVRLEPRAGLSIEVQRVDHPSRVHMDFEAENVDAEVARFEGFGAAVRARIHDWVVMEAPAGA